jgi:hypothetical protein
MMRVQFCQSLIFYLNQNALFLDFLLVFSNHSYSAHIEITFQWLFCLKMYIKKDKFGVFKFTFNFFFLKI